MKRPVERLGADERGAVAPIIAISLFALIAAAGIAFDYARMAGMDTELQSAADQAALAAASQLDGKNAAESGGLGACTRARQAALALLTNKTFFANDGGTPTVAITDADDPTDDDDEDPQCNNADGVRFYQDKAATIEATTDDEARFVEVTVNGRRANFALTVVVSAFSSGDVAATARAGLGSALCKVPPLMICSPTPGVDIDWNTRAGWGVRAVDDPWTPGGFGFLGDPDANATKEALAFQNPTFSCQSIDTGEVSTGQAGAITAINTRFDIYDYGNGSGEVLAPCSSGSCPAALNVAKDVVRPSPSGQNACRIHNNGWTLPANRFVPGNTPDANGNLDPDGSDAMGLPRDNCHYESYVSAGGSACPGATEEDRRFGDGNWARADYFNKYHGGTYPTEGGTSATRYQTYLWELDGNMPDQSAASGHSAPICSTGTLDPTRDRRVVQVAVGDNCAAQHGVSGTLEIIDWVEMFLVEPGLPSGGPQSRGNGDDGNEIYLEVIREIESGGATAQVVRRDVPYLVR